MLRVENGDSSVLETTTMNAEGYDEEDLREWLLANPRQFFDEDILIIGREVSIEGIGDGIDVLGIDRDGNLVVVELKRGALRGDVDFQMLKYASYVSRWGHSKIKTQFESFARSTWGTELYGDDPDFTETLEEFCNDEYELNGNQRLIYVGNAVRERIGSVVLWLREQGIEATIVEFTLFKNNDNDHYLDAKTTVPTSSLDKFSIGTSETTKPWKEDGKAWHLKERSNEETATLVQEIISAFQDIDVLGEPRWQQKIYIAFRIDRRNRVLLFTQKQLVRVELRDYPIEQFDASEIATRVGIDETRIMLESELWSNNPGMRINCYPEEQPDVSALTEFVREVVASEEAEIEV